MHRACPTIRAPKGRWLPGEPTARPMPRMSGAGTCRALSIAMPSRASSARLPTKRPSVTLRDMLSQMPCPCGSVICHPVSGSSHMPAPMIKPPNIPCMPSWKMVCKLPSMHGGATAQARQPSGALHCTPIKNVQPFSRKPFPACQLPGDPRRAACCNASAASAATHHAQP